jgi:cell division protein FtsB
MPVKFVLRRSIHSAAQVVFLLFVIAAGFITLDLNRRERDGRLVGAGADELQVELNEEVTREVQLKATLEFVQSDEYVAIYAREEGGMLLPGEMRIVPLEIEATPGPVPLSQPTPDPALYARPWQVWWSLLSDAPLPSR